MDKGELSRLLGGWEGYVLGTVGRQAREDGQSEVWIELLPRAGRPRRCHGCGHVTTAVQNTEERWVRDSRILDAETWLLMHRVRVNCPTCGPRIEELDWLVAYARLTRRLADVWHHARRPAAGTRRFF